MYPGALHLGRGLDAKERKLEKPALPWLLVQVEIDLTTAEGRAAAQREYAFLNEPFAPVLTIATIKGCSGDTFLKTASTLCNNYLFGTLSASLTVPDNKLNDVNVEECLSSMRYGSIVLNAWSAQCYGLLGCSWGAYPGETLSDVQSGIGQIHNFWFIPHAQKCVLRLPCVTSANDLFKNDNPVRGTLLYTRLGDFLLNPGVGTFFKFIVAQMDGVKLAVGGAGMVGISAFILKKLLK
jgi:aldehyde dehydrogenase (NAD(P)+)